MNYKQEYIKKIALAIKAQGFRVFIAKSGEHGFYTNKEGSRVVCFQDTLGVLSFSGNYISKGNGSGWRITDNDKGDYKEIFNTYPPHWAVGSSQWQFKTFIEYLKNYQRSSKFKEV